MADALPSKLNKGFSSHKHKYQNLYYKIHIHADGLVPPASSLIIADVDAEIASAHDARRRAPPRQLRRLCRQVLNGYSRCKHICLHRFLPLTSAVVSRA
eukprot:2036223-Pleurochrysis_carterae.AAC.5